MVDLERGIYIVTALRNYFKKLGVVEVRFIYYCLEILLRIDLQFIHENRPGVKSLPLG